MVTGWISASVVGSTVVSGSVASVVGRGSGSVVETGSITGTITLLRAFSRMAP